MQLKTILNRVQRHKSFVYGAIQFAEIDARLALEVEIRARANGQAVCSGCGRRGPGYDRLPQRRFEFVPLWGMAVFFLYAPRRVDCRRCGVTVEQVAWAHSKSPMTTTYLWFLAAWAKRLPWQEVAEAFRTTWKQRLPSGNAGRAVGHSPSVAGRHQSNRRR
jgi:transposase